MVGGSYKIGSGIGCVRRKEDFPFKVEQSYTNLDPQYFFIIDNNLQTQKSIILHGLDGGSIDKKFSD